MNALENASTTIGRDMKLNFQRTYRESSLTPEEASLTLAAVAQALGSKTLSDTAEEDLKSLGADLALITEAKEVGALLSMLNVYYRFKHFVGKDEDYKNAQLRMTAFSKPALGKERFEMLSFAVSVVNGCEQCVRSHEEALRGLGLTSERIHDLARLSAVARGVGVLLQ